MKKHDNPAERLSSYLKLCTEVDYPHSVKTKIAWIEIFNIKNNESDEIDDAEILMKVAELMKLLSSVKLFMNENFNDLPWKGTVWWSGVNKAFQSMDYNGNFDSFTKHITPTIIAEVNWLSLLINSHGSYSPLDKEKIQEMIKSVNEMKADVVNSELTENMKKQFLRYLNKITMALEDYCISGAEPVLDSLECAVGHLVFDEEYRNCIAHDNIGKKFIGLVSFIADTVTIACGLPQLAPIVSNIFLKLK